MFDGKGTELRFDGAYQDALSAVKRGASALESLEQVREQLKPWVR